MEKLTREPKIGEYIKELKDDFGITTNQWAIKRGLRYINNSLPEGVQPLLIALDCPYKIYFRPAAMVFLDYAKRGERPKWKELVDGIRVFDPTVSLNQKQTNHLSIHLRKAGFNVHLTKGKLDQELLRQVLFKLNGTLRSIGQIREFLLSEYDIRTTDKAISSMWLKMRAKNSVTPLPEWIRKAPGMRTQTEQVESSHMTQKQVEKLARQILLRALQVKFGDNIPAEIECSRDRLYRCVRAELVNGSGEPETAKHVLYNLFIRCLNGALK